MLAIEYFTATGTRPAFGPGQYPWDRSEVAPWECNNMPLSGCFCLNGLTPLNQEVVGSNPTRPIMSYQGISGLFGTSPPKTGSEKIGETFQAVSGKKLLQPQKRPRDKRSHLVPGDRLVNSVSPRYVGDAKVLQSLDIGKVGAACRNIGEIRRRRIRETFCRQSCFDLQRPHNKGGHLPPRHLFERRIGADHCRNGEIPQPLDITEVRVRRRDVGEIRRLGIRETSCRLSCCDLQRLYDEGSHLVPRDIFRRTVATVYRRGILHTPGGDAGCEDGVDVGLV